MGEGGREVLEDSRMSSGIPSRRLWGIGFPHLEVSLWHSRLCILETNKVLGQVPLKGPRAH